VLVTTGVFFLTIESTKVFVWKGPYSDAFAISLAAAVIAKTSPSLAAISNLIVGISMFFALTVALLVAKESASEIGLLAASAYSFAWRARRFSCSSAIYASPISLSTLSPRSSKVCRAFFLYSHSSLPLRNFSSFHKPICSGKPVLGLI
jgi:hypothetical protein